MLIRSLPIINAYIDALSDSLKSIKPSAQLTRAQKAKLAIIIIGIIVTESLNWAAFERRSLGKVKPSSLYWFFYSANSNSRRIYVYGYIYYNNLYLKMLATQYRASQMP